jgi:hypothetical protein
MKTYLEIAAVTLVTIAIIERVDVIKKVVYPSA